jgi:hypothetical protein|uniref:Uncharacterized protein n=1 Tax=Eutreptiella gymnastica TaxID=73025 RepID=A0A7S4CDV5_9EUGL
MLAATMKTKMGTLKAVDWAETGHGQGTGEKLGVGQGIADKYTEMQGEAGGPALEGVVKKTGGEHSSAAGGDGGRVDDHFRIWGVGIPPVWPGGRNGSGGAKLRTLSVSLSRAISPFGHESTRTLLLSQVPSKATATKF